MNGVEKMEIDSIVEKMEIELLVEKEFDIFDLVLKTMEHVDKFTSYAGIQKKKYVMCVIKFVIVDRWGYDCYLKYEFIVPLIIEFVIMISKNEILIDINKRVKKCFPHFPCF